MKPLLAVVGVVAALAAAEALFAWQPWDGGSAAGDEPAASASLSGSSCQRMAGLARVLAEGDPAPRDLIRELGRRVAGIRPPPRGIFDLAQGGRNLIPGRGFRGRYDDGTGGQARHFSGIAVATTYGGGDPTRWISEHLRSDPAGSPDGRLSDEGIAFATGLLNGRIAIADSSDWLYEKLCRPRSLESSLRLVF